MSPRARRLTTWRLLSSCVSLSLSLSLSWELTLERRRVKWSLETAAAATAAATRLIYHFDTQLLITNTCPASHCCCCCCCLYSCRFFTDAASHGDDDVDWRRSSVCRSNAHSTHFPIRQGGGNRVSSSRATDASNYLAQLIIVRWGGLPTSYSTVHLIINVLWLNINPFPSASQCCRWRWRMERRRRA